METSAASIVGTESLDELVELSSLRNCKSVSFGRATTSSGEHKIEPVSEWSPQHSALVLDFLSTQCPRLEMLNFHQFIVGSVEHADDQRLRTQEVMSEITMAIWEQQLLVGLNFLCVTEPMWLGSLAKHFRGFAGVFCVCTAVRMPRDFRRNVCRWLAEFITHNPIMSLKLVCMDRNSVVDVCSEDLKEALVQSNRLRHLYIRSGTVREDFSCWQVLVSILSKNPFIEVVSAQFQDLSYTRTDSIVEAILEHPQLWNVCIHKDTTNVWKLLSCERLDALALGNTSPGLFRALETRQTPLVLRCRDRLCMDENLPVNLPQSVDTSSVIDWLGVSVRYDEFLRLLHALSRRSDLEEVRLKCRGKLDPTELWRSVAKILNANGSLHTLELDVPVRGATFTRDFFAAITAHECLSQIRLQVRMNPKSMQHFGETERKFRRAYEANDSISYISINGDVIGHLAMERHQLARWMLLNWIRSRVKAELFDVEILRLVLAYGRIGCAWFDDAEFLFFSQPR